MERDTPGAPARVAILGLGMMGGSLGLALKRARPATEVAGYDAAPGVAERARARGAIDRPAASVADALGGASLVVIAAPTLAAEGLLAEIGARWDALAPNVVITDLCSVKSPVVEWARARLPQPARFAGGHPMCGSERTGIDAADAGLYTGARWVIIATLETAPDALAQVEALARAVRSHPLVMDAAAHDEAVAGASHLPLAVAATLAGALAQDPSWPVVARLAAGGYRDTTRVAAGSPIMGRDILLANRERVLARLDAFMAALERLREAVARGDGPAVEALLRMASDARRAWAAERERADGDTDGVL
ncbi:MAG TPA: prephenate dehydrogenase/arogenate dehydrogenase family protein [Ktedonobacterales bacterium]|nr:prephenate dehydrogenase/arogenate dehydrogenase family protein [Ktedonobacterales bacterium]